METNKSNAYPKSIYCIIIYEFCERFSFCGIRTILSLYLRNELLLSENAATVIYHIFNMACHAVPILGAICADSFLGRYRTITYFTSVYMLGNILLCLACIPFIPASKNLISILSLVLLALGTGALKPCVAAFGGDQFKLPAQQTLLRHFFSMFYFTINLGGFMGMIASPILRKWFKCFGEDSCYALGFGVPAAIMASGLVVLCLGRIFYKVRTPKSPVIQKFTGCIWHALVVRTKTKPKLEGCHWLDYAKEDYSDKLIGDVKIVFAIFLLYIPLPLFWSLFDQQGSRWTFQASHMNGNFLGTQILPDQMQVMNPVIVLFLIPLFEKCLYPLSDRFGVMVNPLHRMAIGGILAGLAFYTAGILELVLQAANPNLPDQDHATLHFINTLPCDVQIHNSLNTDENLEAKGMWSLKSVPLGKLMKLEASVEAPTECGNLKLGIPVCTVKIDTPQEYEVATILIGLNEHENIQAFTADNDEMWLSQSGNPKIRVAYIKTSKDHKAAVTLKSRDKKYEESYKVPQTKKAHAATSAYLELSPGINDCIVTSDMYNILLEKSFHLDLGGVYIFVMRENLNKVEFAKVFTVAEANNINMLWLLPQYFLISVAEIMFGVAGLEFSFTQAPKSMKTVTIAGWYLTVAIGNLIVIFITQARLVENQAYEFFLFAVLIVADMILFAELGARYRFVNIEADSSVAVMAGDKKLEDKYLKTTSYLNFSMETVYKNTSENVVL